MFWGFFLHRWSKFKERETQKSVYKNTNEADKPIWSYLNSNSSGPLMSLVKHNPTDSLLQKCWWYEINYMALFLFSMSTLLNGALLPVHLHCNFQLLLFKDSSHSPQTLHLGFRSCVSKVLQQLQQKMDFSNIEFMSAWV